MCFLAFSVFHVFIFSMLSYHFNLITKYSAFKHLKKSSLFLLPTENKPITKLLSLTCMAFLNTTPTSILKFVVLLFLTYLIFHSNLIYSSFSKHHLHFLIFLLLKLLSCYIIIHTSEFLIYFKTYLRF